MPAMPALKMSNLVLEMRWERDYEPTPESKSGTIAANVIMTRCSHFLRSDHYTELIDKHKKEVLYGCVRFEGHSDHLRAAATVSSCHPVIA